MVVASLGLYGYCANNPVRYTDPDGKSPNIYYDDYGNPSSTPCVITGRNIGEPILYFLTPKEVYSRIKNAVMAHNLMGKAYSTGNPAYVCTTFLREALTLSGVNAEDYLPGGQLVKDSMDLLAGDGSYFSPGKGKNPEEGTYVFYYLYANGTEGHTGIVYFDSNGNATILHNGGNGFKSKLVNEYVRDNRDLATWFQESIPGPVYYKRINIVEEL